MWKPKSTVQNKRCVWHILLTVGVVLAVLAANLGLMVYAAGHTLFVDTTAEGRFTVREEMLDFLKKAEMKDDVDILFCADADVLRGTYDTNLLYTLALQLEEEIPNIHVDTVNIDRYPEAVEAYKRNSATVIAWNDVIISSGTEFRVYKARAFFTSSQETGEILGFNGELKMCEAILSMTAKSLPLACFTVGNGEVLPNQSDPETAYLYERIRDAGFTVMAINLETEDIPDDCTLLIINGPTKDFPSDRYEDLTYVSPITKIDRFLDRFGSVYYFRDPAAGTLPNLEEFLREWGVSFSVKDSSGTVFDNVTLQDTGAALSGDPNRICGVYGNSSVYEDITSLESPPKTVFENCAPVNIIWADNMSNTNTYGRVINSLFTTTNKAYAVNAAGETVAGGTYPLMTMTSETRVINNDYFTATLFVCGTTAYHAAAYMEDNVYANGEILQSTVRGAAVTTVSVADALPFKYYETPAFTQTEDESDNTIYKTDANGNVLWTTDDNGYSHRVVDRIIRPIGDGERTAWLWVLCGLPLILLGIGGTVVTVRRRNR